MKKRILCTCLVLMLTLCGCEKDIEKGKTPSTTVSSTSAIAITSDHPTHTFAPTLPLTSSSERRDPSETTASSASITNTDADSTTATQPTTPKSTTTMSSTVAATATHATPTATTTRPTYTFSATVRDERGRLVSGVAVSVWASADVQIGTAVTNNQGVARITLENKLSTYRVKLSNLPQGYEADPEYRFSTTMVNITLRKSATQNEADHSNAQYDIGKTMTNFILTDTNGNTYRLADLLKEKKLIILDFWFANCQPCKEEFPFFEAATKAYGDDMALLAINPIDNLKTINALRNQFNANPNTAITFPMLQDTCNLFLGFEVTAYPTTIFVDSDGCILDIHVGTFPTKEAFLATVARYLQ